MGKKRFSAVAICAVAVVGVGAGSAFAGEVTGKGGSTPVQQYRAGSICAFSGLEDWASTAPQPDNGQLVKPGVVQHPAPGDLHGGNNACRGFASGGGGEG